MEIAEVGLKWRTVEYESDQNAITIFSVQSCEPDRCWTCNWRDWELLVC